LPPVVEVDVDARRWFVEEKDSRLVRKGFGDHHAALHAARQGHDLAVLLKHPR
jgi:hypothetical protein